MTLAEFLRLYPLRAPHLMWFLGAGASASAGVPTAGQMTWDFKRTLYCSDQRMSLRACSDLSSAAVRARLQAHFDGRVGFSPKDSPDEYAYYFEAAYPAEADRRRYIAQCMSGARPSFGHVGLAGLMKLGMARLIWTTNFDRLVEDAAFEALQSSAAVVVATLDNAEVARQAVDEGRAPLIVKLHGDFQSRRLKNTADEVRAQDGRLRECLVERCSRQGLIVVGYSGRDDAVMSALEAAIGAPNSRGYPSGLFWFHRSDAEVLPRVRALIAGAQAVGIEAHLVNVETFDELLGDVLLLVSNVPEDVAARLNRRALRVSDAPIAGTEGSWPVLRLNALPLLAWPTQCRRVVCSIGGIVEVREAVARSGADIIATRRQAGVLAFGSDSEVRKAFEGRGIADFDLYSIEARRLRYEGAELSLLYDALARALARERGLKTRYRRSGFTAYTAAENASGSAFDLLREEVGSLGGVIPQTTLWWAEAIDVRLEWRLGRLFLLFEPTIRAEATDDDKARDRRREFIRERLSGRFNPVWNKLFDAWARIIVGDGEDSELRAFGISDGADAVFRVSRTTAFSWLIRP